MNKGQLLEILNSDDRPMNTEIARVKNYIADTIAINESLLRCAESQETKHSMKIILNQLEKIWDMMENPERLS